MLRKIKLPIVKIKMFGHLAFSAQLGPNFKSKMPFDHYHHYHLPTHQERKLFYVGSSKAKDLFPN